MRNHISNNIIRYLLLSILVLSSLSLLLVYNSNYIAEALMARSLPLAIVIGFTAIAVAIYEKK